MRCIARAWRTPRFTSVCLFAALHTAVQDFHATTDRPLYHGMLDSGPVSNTQTVKCKMHRT